MKIILDSKFTAIVVDNFLGNYKEQNSRYINVINPFDINTNCFIQFLIDNNIYESDIIDNKALIPSIVFNYIGEIKCQWIGLKSEILEDGTEKKTVIKSQIFTGIVKQSIDNILVSDVKEIEHKDYYQEALNKVNNLPVIEVISEEEFNSLSSYLDKIYLVTSEDGSVIHQYYGGMIVNSYKSVYGEALDEINESLRLVRQINGRR